MVPALEARELLATVLMVATAVSLVAEEAMLAMKIVTVLYTVGLTVKALDAAVQSATAA